MHIFTILSDAARLMLASCGFEFLSIPATDMHRHNVHLHILRRGNSKNDSRPHNSDDSDDSGPLCPIVILHGVGIGTLLYTEMIQLLAASGEW